MTNIPIFQRLKQSCFSHIVPLLIFALGCSSCSFYEEAHQYHRWHMQQIQRPWPDVSSDSCSEELYEDSETFVNLFKSEKGGYPDA